jgi:two-component system, sensor histidine kinase LadS
MSSFRLIFLVFFFGQIALPAYASPENFQQASAYWIDHGRHADIDAAMKADFVPYQGILALGYLPATVWIRLRVAPATNRKSLILRISPAYLREITLYDPAQRQDGRIVAQLSGRLGELARATYQGLNSGYLLEPEPQARDIYLRIRTPTAMVFDSQILRADDELRIDRLDLAGKLFYAALLLFSSVWALVNFLILRESLYGWFALRQLYSTTYVLIYFGMLRFFLSSYLNVEIQDHIYNAVFSLAVLPIAVFEVRLLREFQTSPRLRQVGLAIALLSLASPLMMLLGHVQWALQFCVTLVLLASVIFPILAFSAKQQKELPLQQLALRVLRIGYLLMAAMIFFPAIEMLFGLHLDWLYLSTPVAHAAISTIVVMALLAIRSRRLQLLRQHDLVQRHQIEADLSRERAVRQEKQQLISVLTHELKNPLSVVRLLTPADTSAGQAIQQATDDMYQVIERVYQSEKIFDLNIRPTKEVVNLHDVLEQVRLKQRQPERIHLVFDCESAVCTDRELLQAILGNLLDNALKYSPPDSIVRCVVSEEHHAVRQGVAVLFHNQPGNAGLPDPAQLFTKYYRSPQAHRQIGSGLGLYLVAQWINALGGTVRFLDTAAESEPAEICFEVFIPQS